MPVGVPPSGLSLGSTNRAYFREHSYNPESDTVFIKDPLPEYRAIEIKHVSEPVSLLFLLDSKNTLVGIAVKGASHVIKQKVD